MININDLVEDDRTAVIQVCDQFAEATEFIEHKFKGKEKKVLANLTVQAAVAYVGEHAKVEDDQEILTDIRNQARYCGKNFTYEINGVELETEVDEFRDVQHNEGLKRQILDPRNWRREGNKYVCSVNLGLVIGPYSSNMLEDAGLTREEARKRQAQKDSQKTRR
jgi:hypothetical protein